MQLVERQLYFKDDGKHLKLPSVTYAKEGWQFQESVEEPDSVDCSKLVAVRSVGPTTRAELIKFLNQSDLYSVLGVRMWWSVYNTERPLLRNFSTDDKSVRFLFGATTRRMRTGELHYLATRKHLRSDVWKFDKSSEPAEHNLALTDYVICLKR